jgi:hypothetical protein
MTAIGPVIELRTARNALPGWDLAETSPADGAARMCTARLGRKAGRGGDILILGGSWADVIRDIRTLVRLLLC